VLALIGDGQEQAVAERSAGRYIHLAADIDYGDPAAQPVSNLQPPWTQRRAHETTMSQDDNGQGDPGRVNGEVPATFLTTLRCWPWTCSPGASWPRSSTANGS
jgi:hypothetical protein